MKRKHIHILEINHELYLTTYQETIYNQGLLYQYQETTIEFRPKKRIKMSKRKSTRQGNMIVAKRNRLNINVTKETEQMSAYDKGKWFERKVNEVLKSDGMITTPSSDGYFDKEEGYVMTGDGGIDISAQVGEKQVIIQCKCHKEPVSASVVREMKGIIANRPNTLGVICAITYSQNAINEANNTQGKIILTTINDITGKIRNALSQFYSTKQIKMAYKSAEEIEYTTNSVKVKNIIDGEIYIQYK